jgi:hypothetical protein
MKQVLYHSLNADRLDDAALAKLLAQSRHNNALDGITGLLWSDGKQFMQVLEGPRRSVTATYDRIVEDPRHCRITLLLDGAISAREFGGWTMVHRQSTDPVDIYAARVQRLCIDATSGIKDAFIQVMKPIHDGFLSGGI